MTTHAGMTSYGEFDPTWADVDICEVDETPIHCEFRIDKPSVIVINFGIADAGYLTPGQFEFAIQRILNTSLEAGVVPILSTSALSTGQPFHDRGVVFNRII